jgi:hypothetical protein
MEMIKRPRVSTISRASGTLVLIANIVYLLPLTITIIWTEGGPMGIGLLVIPVLAVCHLFCIPAILSWRTKKSHDRGILVANVLGLVWCMFYTLIPFIHS